MRLSLLLASLSAASSSDVCADFCKKTAGICGSKGSYCKNSYACHDLYYTDNTKKIVCSSASTGCPKSHPVLCVEMRGVLDQILNSGGKGPEVVPRPATATKDDLANELPKEKKDKSVVSAAKKAAKTPLPRKMDTKSEDADLKKAIEASLAEQKQAETEEMELQEAIKSSTTEAQAKTVVADDDKGFQEAVEESLKEKIQRDSEEKELEEALKASLIKEATVPEKHSGLEEAIKGKLKGKKGSGKLTKAQKQSLANAPKKESESSSSEEEDLAKAIAMSLSEEKSSDPPKRKLSEEEELELAIAKSLSDEDEDHVIIDPRPGHIGFVNIGATCYLSAALQVLSHARPLIQSLRIVNPNPISDAVMDMLNQMWEQAEARGGEPIMPVALLHAIHTTVGIPDQFVPERMEDASEVLYILLNALDAATRAEDSADSSPVARVMMSALSNTRTCTVCSVASKRVEPQFQMHVPIPAPKTKGGAVTLSECITAQSVEENIEGYACDKCAGRTHGLSKTTIARMGDLLMVTLRRFRPVKAKDGSIVTRKVHTVVNYPAVLATSNGKEYDLIGVIHHQGDNKESGHYVAEVYHDQDKEWLHANDRQVTPIPQPELVSKTAYIFLYKRRTV